VKTTQAYCKKTSTAPRWFSALVSATYFAALIITSFAGSLAAQSLTPRNYTVDVGNRYPQVGALIIVVVPNTFGVPEGIRAFCSGALIEDRVFLTAGHCTGPSYPPLPPFINIVVGFAPNVLDPSKWIPVAAQVTHPSLPLCLRPVGCDPTTTGAFTAGDPSVTDLGLVFLTRPAPSIRPADLAFPGELENQKAELPMATVGFGFPLAPSGGGSPDVSLWDGLRKYRTSKLAQILNGQWASWELPSSVCFGDSGAPTFLDSLPEIPENHQTIVAIASDGGIDCLSKDIRTRVDTHAAQDWIKSTVKQQLR